MNATESRVLITGNTYPVREQLKMLGARWDAGSKGWLVSADKVEEARALVAGAASKPFVRTTCRTCGVRGSQYNPIYRSGDCKECWVSEKEEREMGY